MIRFEFKNLAKNSPFRILNKERTELLTIYAEAGLNQLQYTFPTIDKMFLCKNEKYAFCVYRNSENAPLIIKNNPSDIRLLTTGRNNWEEVKEDYKLWCESIKSEYDHDISPENFFAQFRNSPDWNASSTGETIITEEN